MTTMNRESMDETVMRGLMEILVRRLSMVFGKEESEVRGAVGEEMAGLEAGYKKWLSAMSGVAPKKAPKAPKEKEEKAPKAPKEKVEKAPKAPKEPKAVKGGKVVKAPKEEVNVVASEATAVVEEAPVSATAVVEEAPVVSVTAVVEEAAVSVAVKASPPKAKKAVAPKEPKAAVAPKEPKAAKAKAAPKKKEVPVAVVVPVAVAEEEEEEVEVEEIEYEGVKYLRSNKGIVYDPETSEEVGRWNEEMSSIEVD